MTMAGPSDGRSERIAEFRLGMARKILAPPSDFRLESTRGYRSFPAHSNREAR
jgi:hypothetical protein